MGWFGFEIMAGDPPMDIEDAIWEFFNIDQYKDNWDENISPDIFIDKTDELIASLFDSIYEYDRHLILPVLGVIMMKVGAEISDEVRDKMASAARDDKWSKEEPQRMVKMQEFIKTIRNYKTTPTSIECKGLFQRIAEGENGKN